MKRAGIDDPVDIIREDAKKLVATAKSAGWNGPPFKPLELASFLGIRSKPAANLFSAEAQLRPMPGRQLLLEFNPERAEVRQNYSICHEIGHTLFDDCYEIVHCRRSKLKGFDPEDEVEFLCQIAAAELLMPEAEYRADLFRLPLSLSSVRFLVDRYQASREAVLRRMVDLSDRPCAAVFFSERLSPKEQLIVNDSGKPNVALIPKMRILYRVPSADFPIFLPIHKSVPDHSCVRRATVIDAVTSQRETWELEGFGDWVVEAMTLPIRAESDEDVPSVAALIIP
ncbi:MAG TPA: ImmA/IrrE family metallo-endopeptidase [Tepidisphaeraceae bacterium]|nr:ImmA/IrrE family metallo-endopeptidase [Tepidisphaeraceae bacterium]